MQQIHVYIINLLQVHDKCRCYVIKKAAHLTPAALCASSRLLLTSKTDDYAASAGEAQQREGDYWGGISN